MIGGVCYVDHYAGNLQGVKAKVPYFKDLGLTYLHLMPIFTRPEHCSDGGYAVSSYRDIDPKLGTVEDLKDLADTLREAGISLVLDFGEYVRVVYMYRILCSKQEISVQSHRL